MEDQEKFMLKNLLDVINFDLEAANLSNNEVVKFDGFSKG